MTFQSINHYAEILQLFLDAYKSCMCFLDPTLSYRNTLLPQITAVINLSHDWGSSLRDIKRKKSGRERERERDRQRDRASGYFQHSTELVRVCTAVMRKQRMCLIQEVLDSSPASFCFRCPAKPK